MAEHLEIEQKFEVDDDFARPGFGALPGDITVAEPVTHHLSATYYDTPDQRLAAAKITLRRRTGGGDEGWHMKLPVSEGTRRELQEPLSDELPPALAARAAEITGGAPVTPVAILDTERIIVALTSGGPVSSGGTLVAEVADDRVTGRRLAGGAGPVRWREIEVEVPEPCPPVQEAVAKLLMAAGARPSRSSSKVGRVLGS
jgi:inorganic triphosphatase YgiF